ncbi:MAG: hypothetical protein DMD29_03835 [Gemmatimonadetes bacterium]|nr:MAG: hypothetical protein DMD29_03835 [Gemmatimonadota bacterium]
MDKGWVVTITLCVMSLSVASIFVLLGPVGRALGERLSGRKRLDDQELRDLRGEVEDLRHQLGDVQERVDFAERLLAKQRVAQHIGTGE